MILHGRNLIIKKDGVALAAAKSCIIEVQADDIEVSSPLTGQWKTYIAGRKSWKTDVSGLVPFVGDNPSAGVLNLARMAGQVVSLAGYLSPHENMYPGILPFAGWTTVDPEDIQHQSLFGTPEAIFYDGPEGYFVGRKDEKWYRNWTGGSGYADPSEGAYFHDLEEDQVYVVENGYLEGYADLSVFGGNALCKSCRISGSLGNLATYTAQFLGSGFPSGIGSQVSRPSHVHGQVQAVPGSVLAADGTITLSQTGAEVQALLNKMAALELATEADIEAAFGGE